MSFLISSLFIVFIIFRYYFNIITESLLFFQVIYITNTISIIQKISEHFVLEEFLEAYLKTSPRARHHYHFHRHGSLCYPRSCLRSPAACGWSAWKQLFWGGIHFPPTSIVGTNCLLSTQPVFPYRLWYESASPFCLTLRTAESLSNFRNVDNVRDFFFFFFFAVCFYSFLGVNSVYIIFFLYLFIHLFVVNLKSAIFHSMKTFSLTTNISINDRKSFMAT